MKHLKYIILFILPIAMFSCLKERKDFAGLLNDEGGIVLSMKQQQYLNAVGANPVSAAGNNDPAGLQSHAHFNFTNRPNEAVWFFTIHVAQPREKKMTSDLVVNISKGTVQTGLSSLYGSLDFPAGSITVPTSVTIPKSDESSFDFPVYFNVNKTMLDPDRVYAVRFTMTSTNQGVVSASDKFLDVIVNYGDASDNRATFQGFYKCNANVTDPSGVLNATNNSRELILYPNGTNQLAFFSNTSGSAQEVAFNITTGAIVRLFTPLYNLDPTTGKVVVTIGAQGNGGTVSNIVMDAATPNQFVYTSSSNKTANIKYSFTLSTGTNVRIITVTDQFQFWIYQIY